MNGQYNDLVDRLFVIDCRYPYEYDGGHIKVRQLLPVNKLCSFSSWYANIDDVQFCHFQGALNFHHEDQIEDYFLRNPILSTCPEKRVLLVFHCEFSSERGPRMCRYVRERDRLLNEYPNLHYPELYILKGGYKEFFPIHKVCMSFFTKLNQDKSLNIFHCLSLQRIKLSKCFCLQSVCEPQDYRPMAHEDFKEDYRKFRLKSRTWSGERSKRDMYSRLKKLWETYACFHEFTAF